MLNDPIDEVRARAAWTLDNLKEQRAFPALIKAIHDQSFGVRSAMERIYRESDNYDAREMALLVLKYL